MRKIPLFFCVIFFNALCFAETIIISLGENCNVAMALNEHQLRMQSFPFDWNITPFDSLYSIIENDFDDFLNPEHLVLRDDLRTVVDIMYGIEFAHDFPTYIPEPQGEDLFLLSINPIRSNFLDALSAVQEKYQRRIQRFYRVLNGTDEVIFIRHNNIQVPKEDVLQLYKLIRSKFSNLNFLLVVWGYSDDLTENWGLEGITSFQMRPGSDMGVFFEQMFNSLNLIR